MELVAEKAGVSITTVSHVINRTRHVNQSTKDAVLKVIRELNYRSSKMYKTSDNGAGICVGVILADAREDYYTLIMKAIEMVAADYDVSVVFCDSEADYEKEVKNISLLQKQKVDGILLSPADADQMPKALGTISIPVVLFDRQYESHPFLSVGINNFRGGYLGTKNLLDKGCKNIGLIGYSDPVNTQRQRILGYKSALMEHNSGTAANVLYLKYNGGDSFPLIKRFLSENDFDGLVCATSGLCYELIEVIDSMEDKNKTRIISFDDNRWLDYVRYPISVISQPVAEIASAALEGLLQLIEQPASTRSIKRELSFEVTIIDR